jgi:hypothetical protein
MLAIARDMNRKAKFNDLGSGTETVKLSIANGSSPDVKVTLSIPL